MTVIGVLVLFAFTLLVVAGPHLSDLRATPRSTVPIMSHTTTPDPLPPQDPGGEFLDAAGRLQDLLAYAPGSHCLLEGSTPRVQVLSYHGDVLTAPGTKAADPQAVQAVHDVLTEAGIQADVERRDHPDYILSGVVTTLHSARDVNKMIQVVLDGLPRPIAMARELVTVLRGHGFVAPDAVCVLDGHVCGVQLTLDDARKVRVALGGLDIKLIANDAELYELADAFARFLSDKLGGRVEIEAHPSRGDLCKDCVDELLVLRGLSVEQTDKLTSALAALLVEVR
ncbi:hypothetical protein [Streptomyces murinus]|uniref:hypothetical protein n=1 Tax=Streptomyces murinus TaxID=33900 RepID=UPI003821289D